MFRLYNEYQSLIRKIDNRLDDCCRNIVDFEREKDKKTADHLRIMANELLRSKIGLQREFKYLLDKERTKILERDIK